MSTTEYMAKLGIIEKKLSEEDVFTDSDDEGYSKDQSFKTDNTFLGLSISCAKENENFKRSSQHYLDSEVVLNDNNFETKHDDSSITPKFVNMAKFEFLNKDLSIEGVNQKNKARIKSMDIKGFSFNKKKQLKFDITSKNHLESKEECKQFEIDCQLKDSELDYIEKL